MCLAQGPQRSDASEVNFDGQLSLDKLYINRKTYYNPPNSAF